MVSLKRLPTLEEKVSKILNEIEGVVHQSNVTSWELTFLRDMRTRQVSFGSPKQNEIVGRIGCKVFGEDDWNEYATGIHL